MVANLYEGQRPAPEPDIEWPGLAAWQASKASLASDSWRSHASAKIKDVSPKAASAFAAGEAAAANALFT